MRRGFQSLSALADMALSVNVWEGRDCVIFVSKSRAPCKAIWSDDTGSMLLTRQLKTGRFAKACGPCAGGNITAGQSSGDRGILQRKRYPTHAPIHYLKDV